MSNDDLRHANLLERFYQGDILAIDALVRLTRPHLIKHAEFELARLKPRLGTARISHALDDAEDLQQETVARVYEAGLRGNFWRPDGATVLTWMKRILTNVLKDRLRKRGIECDASVEVEAIGGPDDFDPGRLAVHDEELEHDRERLATLLICLDSKERSLFLRSHYDGARGIDLARDFRVSRPTVSRWLEACFAKLAALKCEVHVLINALTIGERRFAAQWYLHRFDTRLTAAALKLEPSDAKAISRALSKKLSAIADLILADGKNN